jgi:hypothetical protein
MYPVDETLRPGEGFNTRHVCRTDLTRLLGRLDLENDIVQLTVSHLVRLWQDSEHRTAFSYVYSGFFDGQEFDFESVFDRQHTTKQHVLLPFTAQHHFQLLDVDFDLKTVWIYDSLWELENGKAKVSLGKSQQEYLQFWLEQR